MVSTELVTPALRETLAMVAAGMARAEQPWWIIGSAAVALHGAAVTVADVDVLLGEDDARVLLSMPGIATATGEGTTLFRSAVFARWTAPPLTVEFMAGFRFRAGDHWQQVAPATRQPVAMDAHMLFVPGRTELVAMLAGFGRPKDIQRIAALSLSMDGRTPVPDAG